VKRFLTAGAALGCVLAGSSCAKYQPLPLDPTRSETAIRTRTAPSRLDLESITASALEYSGDIAVARARLAEAQAAVITAGERINPSVNAQGGYNKTPDSVATYSFAADFTIETAGKRGYRVLAAKKAAEAARIGVTEAEWQVRSRVRSAVTAYYFAQRRRASLDAENAIRREIAEIFERRVALGEASNPELNLARAEQASLELAMRAAEGDASQAFALIAEVSAIPLPAFERREFDLSSFESLPDPTLLSIKDVERAGLLNRADIKRTLLEYEAADARLKLEIANQYPNITLGPAYQFQEGFPSYMLSVAIDSLPIFHRREGPIAEADAGRREVAARFTALQATAIGDMNTAHQQYGAAFAELTAALPPITIARQRESAVTRAIAAGESDRLDLTQARLGVIATERARTESLQKAQTALGALEAAAQASFDRPSERRTGN
jgi:outer membrane protein TolC